MFTRNEITRLALPPRGCLAAADELRERDWITRARKTLGGHQGALVAEAIYSLFASFLRLLTTHF